MSEGEEETALNAEASGSGSPVSQGAQNGGMSKSAQKKAAKQARKEALKPERRLAEKIRRRERDAKLKEGYAAGTLSEADRAALEQRRQIQRERKRAVGAVKQGGVEGDWGGGVVVDLGFDDLMSDQEITSMSSQLSYLYSYNRTAPRPFATILHTSFSPAASPRLCEKIIKSNCEKWTRSYWWAEGVENVTRALAAGTNPLKTDPSDPKESATVATPESENHLTESNLPPHLNSAHKLIYLSADSPNELDTLSEDEIYIIGGIVDRNRYKMLCQDKAEKLGIRTARLPIGTYLENMPTRKVLTVNQVFAILVQYVALNSWSSAFKAVIPLRKFQDGKRPKRTVEGAVEKSDGDGGPAEDEDDDDVRSLVGQDHEVNEEALMNTS